MDDVVIEVKKNIEKGCHIDKKGYDRLYDSSISSKQDFWSDHAKKEIHWFKEFSKVKDTDYSLGNVKIKWFEDGQLNVCYNCVDVHLAEHGDKVALIWEGDDPGDSKKYTYNELFGHVCRLANVYKHLGVNKGDRICIYLPMIPEAVFAMLAAARVGAVHSVVFGGFSPDSLISRIEDSSCKLVITADEGVRGGRIIPLKSNVDKALESNSCVESVVVVKRTGKDVSMKDGRDYVYEDLVSSVSSSCECEVMHATDPLFILYTSGSTGKPKGVLHSSGGYLLYVKMTHRYVFDYHEDDVYWCTADVGWVTGHSYIVYGPLANCATSLIFEGVPNYPDYSRFWQVVDKHKVNIFYTAPTAIRALMGQGDEFVKSCSRQSLRVLGTVGEPINPEAWNWYYTVVGDERCPISDTWWQTETGGIMISPLPGATALKPGSATLPFFGVELALVDEKGNELSGAGSGNLVIKDSWPGQMMTVYGDHERFEQVYFSICPGYYFTGDGCRRDEDGYYWITGRVDDVINVSGHRLGTAEIESALGSHEKVSEAAVVGYPHDIKGQGIYCYVTLMKGERSDENCRQDLVKWVRSVIGAFAAPDVIHFTLGLPKTRSGKIMRRILRKIAENQLDDLGDTSTLADESVVVSLIKGREDILLS